MMMNNLSYMKKTIVIILIIILILFGGYFVKRKYLDPKHRLNKAISQVKELTDNNKLKNGDIVFQTSLSKQSKAIQLATHSRYSHCGLIFNLDTGQTHWYVLEAVQPVKYTRLDKWIARGEGGHYVIKRTKNDFSITDEKLLNLKTIAEKYLGKDYDLYFDWSDDKIYCSELIWKAYNQLTGLDFGKLQKLKDFDLTNNIVKETLKKRYGDKIPMNETVISPASIFMSDKLITIESDE